ncbi:MAG: helix-hairpin-helix domain-containing protein [Acidobacteria bacterium]|nr:helix-hairpin-helix domain-containing protein [Acidobacteriota bacterium]
MVNGIIPALSLVFAATMLVSAGNQTPQTVPPPSASEAIHMAAQAERDVIGYATVERMCAPCHGLEPLVAAVRTKEEWDATFTKMREAGAQGSELEFQQAFEYVIRNLSALNVNKATAKEIELWLDESDKVALAIVDARNTSGAFKTIDDLKKVPGIDLKKLEARKDRVRF